jgi:hypothetical protein
MRPASAAQGARAERRFTILRDGSDIGRHVIALERRDDAHFLSVDIEIVVRILGIAAYRYEMRNREVWRGGRLESIDCEVNDDGDRKQVRARREGGQLVLDATGYSGPAPDDVATTTYFTQDFLRRSPWISTDNGELLPVAAAQDGTRMVRTGAGEVECARWRVRDGAAFDAELFYDDQGEWVSIAFDAGGAPAIYVPEDVSSRFGAVWSA